MLKSAARRNDVTGHFDTWALELLQLFSNTKTANELQFYGVRFYIMSY